MTNLIVITVSILLASYAVTSAETSIGPLGPPGAPASAFPKPARPVANIVSSEFATEEARDRDGEAKQVMAFLGIGPGMTVADIGAGEGYYTVRVARQVGPNGRVIAEDVMPEYLEKLQQRVVREHLDNVSLDLGDPHDPRLPPKSVDLVLMVHMYHEVTQPYGLLYNLLPGLRDGARIAIIDLERPTEQHGTPHALLLCELHALGFQQTHWGWLRDKAEYLALFEPPKQAPPLAAIRGCNRQ